MKSNPFSAEHIVAVLWLNYRVLFVPIGKMTFGWTA